MKKFSYKEIYERAIPLVHGKSPTGDGYLIPRDHDQGCIFCDNIAKLVLSILEESK